MTDTIDPVEAIRLCSRQTREMIDRLAEERRNIEAGEGAPAMIAADCDYLDFFLLLFDNSAVALDSIAVELADGSEGQAARLRQIAQAATEGRKRCLEFFDNISLEIRNQLVKLQELTELADRLEPPSSTLDRRALFTRFFRR